MVKFNELENKILSVLGQLGNYKDILKGAENSIQELEKLQNEINSLKEDSIRFWKSLGFVENGIDEYGEKLFIKK